MMALEGAPVGSPVAGDPMMALDGAPAAGFVLTAPARGAFVWAGRLMAGAAIKTMAPSKTSPFCAAHDLALQTNSPPILE
jgi:hypothetical protein